MVTKLTTVFAVLCVLSAPLNAEDWVRGSLQIHAVTGEVSVSQLGEEPYRLGPGQVPVYMPTLLGCQAAYGSSTVLSTSNRTFLMFEGDGSFTIERFEQIKPTAEAWASREREPSQSRMIVNFRAGSLYVDSRHMLDSSQCLVETPLGRLSMKRALWHMRIVFDPRSQIFDFTISCSDGRVRFTDLQGMQYTLRTGQRLSGAGARTAPSIEVGEMTGRNREQMAGFRRQIELFRKSAEDLQPFEAHFRRIENSARSGAGNAVLNAPASDQRPVIIEYAREPEAVTPFRGEVRPPSEYQADLF